MRGVRARCVATALAAVALVACFASPDRPGRTDDASVFDSAADDQMTVDEDAIPACMHPVHETFTGAGDAAMPCATWATSFGGNAYGGARGTAVRVGGELRIEGPQMTTFVEGCTSAPFKFANGASVRIPTISAHDSDYAMFTVTAVGHAPTGFQILRSSSLTQLMFVNHLGNVTASATYMPIAMQWFKLMPEVRSSDHVIVGYVGPDGMTWNELGVDNFAPQSISETVTLEISAGGQDNTGYVAFDDVNVSTCPPD